MFHSYLKENMIRFWHLILFIFLTFDWYEGTMVFSVFIFIFLFRSSDKKKKHLDENDCRHGYGNYFKSAILKVTWYQLFSKFSTITRHIDNSIWKKLYSWRFHGHGSIYVLIIPWVNTRKQKWAKVRWKLLIAQKSQPVL